MKTRTLSGIQSALAGLAFVLAACAPAAAQPGEPLPEPLRAELAAAADTGVIEVTGTATVSVPADRARVSFAVETEAATAREAVDENARRMDRVIEAIRGTGIRGLEIETHGYTLQPRYRRIRPAEEGEEPQIVGYTARNHVRVTVDDTQLVGRLIDVAVEAGANRVASLAFEASDTEEARLEALRSAVGKARQEALTIAGALGVPLGDPIHVQGGAEVPQGPIFRSYDAIEVSAARAPTPVEPGEQDVRATVTIRYRIGGS